MGVAEVRPPVGDAGHVEEGRGQVGQRVYVTRKKLVRMGATAFRSPMKMPTCAIVLELR